MNKWRNRCFFPQMDLKNYAHYLEKCVREKYNDSVQTLLWTALYDYIIDIILLKVILIYQTCMECAVPSLSFMIR